MPTSRFQPSFGGGVVAPAIYGRIDTAKYDVGLKVGKNCFVHVHGGISNRAGTEFVAEVMDSAYEHRLIPFRRAEDDNLVLVFGELKMRVIDNGAWLMDGGSAFEEVSPYTAAQAKAMDFAQSIDVVYLAHNDVYPQKLSRTATVTWSFANLQIDPQLPLPVIVSGVPKNAGTTLYDYKVSPVVDGVEGFPSATFQVVLAQDLSVDGAENVLTWTWSGAAGAEFYIYKERNGVFGYIGFTDELTFTDDNIGEDLTVTPVEAAEVFSSSDDFPSVINIFQQRLIPASTNNEPETIFPSRIGDYENFTKSRILRADDSFTKSMSSEGIAKVKAMLQLRELLIFASSGEFSLTGPNGALVATNPIETQFGYSGASDVKPLVVEDTALFVDRTGKQVRDLRYAFEQDGYSGNDLTVFASHYFIHDKIKGWAYAKNPFSVVWVYLESGRLLSLTYKREHQVWAWCDHDLSGGLVEQVAVVPEGDVDRVYFIVKRTVEGATKRYIERMNDRLFVDVEDAWFVDSGVKYDGAAATVISGFDHLEGETLVALAGGNVVTDLVVSNGEITLETAATPVIAGLPYQSEIETLPPAIELQDVGSARGRPMSINKVQIQVENTRGIKAGVIREKLTEYLQTKIDLALPIPMVTDIIPITVFPQWKKDGTVVIRQDYPLPMTVLGVAPEITIGRTD